ncbi:MAG: diguanylate cyclase, partial [Marinomonas hwangdonensis]|nr:diguanylate cyclase [Marinomonas hwangdonensis]
MNKTVLKQPVALLFALFSFFLTGLFGVYWTQSNTQSLINNQQSILSDLSRAQASELERRLSAAFTSAQILAYEVEFNNGTTEWFEDYADKLIKSIGGIENLQLAPEGIISQIYPLEGNEAAIGLDIVSTPRFTTEAMAAIKSRSIFMIGPVPLVQGGVAVISRSPVLLYRDTQRELFWGFASAVVFLDNLLKTTQLIELEKQGYQYRLTRIETGSNLPIELFASEAPLTEIKASTDLVLPVGNWTLSVSLNLTEQLEDRTYSGYILTLIVASLLSSALYFLLMQPIKLAALVKEKTKELQKMAYNDPLTGLANRRFLQDNLPAILMENKDQQRLSAFIYFDLDNFKRINDTIGHDVGDQILTIVADRLNKLRGPSDLVMRLGGDEFGIFLNHVRDKAQVCEQASAILSSIRHPVKIESWEYSLSTSLGIAMIPENGFDLVTVMQNADMALYQAKSQGKNQYAFYTEFMKTHNDNLIKAEEELSKALENGEFEVYFQPQFDLSSNQVFGA